MPVQVQCPNPACRVSFPVADAELGRPGQCPSCGQTVSLRDTEASPDSTIGVQTPLPPTELGGGALFGRYRILRRLGHGGMGTVYLAHDTQLHRDVALKIPHFTAGQAPDIVQRFYREARALARLDHPNICPVHDIGQVAGIPFLTMPYIEGRPLSELVTPPQPLPQRQAAQVVRTLARALAKAHARGIIHRDLKPSNVLIGPRRNLVIIDFGLARPVEAGDARLTQDGSIQGTPAYMAPEQAAGDGAAIGPGCDIYSLGIVLYELLTGRLPFEGSTSKVLGLIQVAEPPPPSQHRPDLDRRLEAICRRAMAKKRYDRYPSMAALSEALDEYLRDAPPAGPTPEIDDIRSDQAADDSSPLKPAKPAPEETLLQGPPRHRRELVAAGLIMVGLLAIVIWVSTDKGTVRIDVKDPAAVVHLDGQEIRIEAMGQPLTLRVGEHDLVVMRDGLVVETRKFEIRRNEQTVVEVAYTPREAAAARDGSRPPPVPAAPEPAPPAVARVERDRIPKPPSSKPPESAVTETVTPSGPSPLVEELTNSLGMKLVRIPPGEFLMGTPASDPVGYPNERPPHRVRITRPFDLGATEVTVGQFRRFVAATGYRTEAERDGQGSLEWIEHKGWFDDQGRNPGSFDDQGRNPRHTWRYPGFFEQTDEHPVVNVSWNDAAAFCQWLSRQEGQTYRLPTEAEWEYACRAGATTRYWSGDDTATLEGVANVADVTAKAKYPNWSWAIAVRDGYVFTAPVGRFRANAWGLYDMHGNVCEWCSDWFDDRPYQPWPVADPTGPSQAEYRAARGGDWYHNPRLARSAFRFGNTPDYRRGDLGFRVARDPSPGPPAASVAIPPPGSGRPSEGQTNSLGMTLVLIPAGEFPMGSPASNQDANPNERPPHRVRITRPFDLGATEVTVGQFRRFVAATGYFTGAERDGEGGGGWDERAGKLVDFDPRFTWQSPGFEQTDEHPVVNVSWNDAVAFCAWLSRQEGQSYRLPTEAEWEYACRAGTMTRYWTGGDPETLAGVANVADATAKEKYPHWTWAIAARDGYVFTAPAGRFRANAWGLHDMHGNVFEWCSDWFDEHYYGRSPVADPVGPPEGTGRLVRGGDWYHNPRLARSAFRRNHTPDFRASNLGFRVARDRSGR